MIYYILFIIYCILYIIYYILYIIYYILYIIYYILYIIYRKGDPGRVEILHKVFGPNIELQKKVLIFQFF